MAGTAPVSPISPTSANIGEHDQPNVTRPGGVETTWRQLVARGFEAVSKVAIDAPKAKVWDALTNPA